MMSKQSPSLEGRVRGTLYGLLIGDALGCPVEGCSPEQIVAQFGRITQMEAPKERQYRPGGLHSDDGQQAIALCDALLSAPQATPEAFARILLELYRAPLPVSRKLSFFFGLHRGHGKNFRATVKALDEGASCRESGQPSSGNGSAMLIAPLAVYFRDADESALQEALIATARVKTYDVRGIAAASSVVFFVRHYLNNGDVWDDETARRLLEFVRQTEERVAEASDSNRRTFSDALARMLADLDGEREAVVAAIGRRASETADAPVFATLGYAPASVVTSIYITLSSFTFRSAVEDVIALGGDTDTTAAMVGAMAGARFGFAAIPAQWYAELHARDAFDDRVEGLLARQPGWRPRTPLVDLETDWCRLYEAPEALARFKEKQRRRRKRRAQTRPVVQPPPVRVEELVIDARWLMSETGRPGGPWLGRCLRALRDRYDADTLATVDEVRELVAAVVSLED